jgi:hypothetical protein
LLSCDLICASTVGCQFNFANQRRQRGNEERNSDLLIDADMDPEEIDMAVGGKKSDQDDQTATSQRHEADAIQNRQRTNAGCSNELLIACRHGSDRKPAEGALLVQVYY